MEALAIWIQDAKGESSLLMRAHGVLADDLTWRQLAPSHRVGSVYMEELLPPPGVKVKKLMEDGQEFCC